MRTYKVTNQAGEAKLVKGLNAISVAEGYGEVIDSGRESIAHYESADTVTHWVVRYDPHNPVHQEGLK